MGNINERALPSSGSISMSQVNTELGRGSTSSINLNDGAVRTLAGRPSGTISMSDLRGKSNVPASMNVTINSNTVKNGTFVWGGYTHNWRTEIFQINSQTLGVRIIVDIHGSSVMPSRVTAYATHNGETITLGLSGRTFRGEFGRVGAYPYIGHITIFK